MVAPIIVGGGLLVAGIFALVLLMLALETTETYAIIIGGVIITYLLYG